MESCFLRIGDAAVRDDVGGFAFGAVWQRTLLAATGERDIKMGKAPGES